MDHNFGVKELNLGLLDSLFNSLSKFKKKSVLTITLPWNKFSQILSYYVTYFLFYKVNGDVQETAWKCQIYRKDIGNFLKSCAAYLRFVTPYATIFTSFSLKSTLTIYNFRSLFFSPNSLILGYVILERIFYTWTKLLYSISFL